jgi:nitroreductase
VRGYRGNQRLSDVRRSNGFSLCIPSPNLSPGRRTRGIYARRVAPIIGTVTEPKTILDSLQWRYATKQFDPNRKISAEHLSTLTEAVRLAPSSFGLQPWKFIVITDAELKTKLMKESWNQTQVRDCSHLFVLTARRNIDEQYVDYFIDSIANTRQTERHHLHGYRNVMADFVKRAGHELPSWATRQVYIALAMLMQTAALLEIDTCPMEGLDPIGYDRVLGLGAEFFTVCACPVGYRSVDDKYAHMKKVRFCAEEVIEYR